MAKSCTFVLIKVLILLISPDERALSCLFLSFYFFKLNLTLLQLASDVSRFLTSKKCCQYFFIFVLNRCKKVICVISL